MSELDEVRRAFRLQVAKEIDSKVDFLARGKADDIEKYRRECGEIAGLRLALGIFNNVAKAHGEQEDE